MPKIDMRKKMNEVLVALNRWEADHLGHVMGDFSPEMKEDWTTDYAICYASWEPIEREFFDFGSAMESYRDAVKKVLGPKFKYFGWSDKAEYKRGDLICVFHGSEIEIYRATKGQRS